MRPDKYGSSAMFSAPQHPLLLWEWGAWLVKGCEQHFQLECGPMPNMMVALPNTGGALCSTPLFG